MKTILVTYPNTKKTKSGKLKKVKYPTQYAYRVAKQSKLKPGCIISAPNKKTKLEVTRVIDKEFKFFNNITGDLTQECNNSNSFEIMKLPISRVTKSNKG